MKKLIVIGCLVSTVGCASYGTWRPTVDPYNDPNAHRIQQDLAECQQLAKQASGGTWEEAVKGGLAGGAIGAATGAVVGALAGAPGKGAAWGAGLGGMSAGTWQGLSAEERYKRVYIQCMRNRGHNVLD